MTMTWKKLADKIAGMTQEQQNTDVTVLLMTSDEVLPIMGCVADEWDEDDSQEASGQADGIDQVVGILDEGHPFLTVDF